ncbi:hypothetical protein DOTSEDRAFT_43790 [Dothistroma septosporum NZE10]|uniref:Uncharacterized protein n=1 Tax=Dothistroma septosporum (strain NZE10 / CBS 128990) TaxID=675120 RepID=N1PPT4_DOTSN|nr:hypothetical protein DOTSEDRAFT_43790 [Dothistroma septosporum NZE10]
MGIFSQVPLTALKFPPVRLARSPTPEQMERRPSRDSTSSSLASSELLSTVPPLIAYRVQSSQVSQLHAALRHEVPKMSAPGLREIEVARFIAKSSTQNTQVLFVMRDWEGTAAPQEALMLSFGRGSRVRLYHASRPATSSATSWFSWATRIASEFDLQMINIPDTIWLSDVVWMLRAHAARAKGDMHAGDTHLINRVERLFANVVFVVRHMAWEEFNAARRLRGKVSCLTSMRQKLSEIHFPTSSHFSHQELLLCLMASVPRFEWVPALASAFLTFVPSFCPSFFFNQPRWPP